jgi:hypothetical protein
MVQVDRVRKGALALPEVEEGTHFGMVAFSVRGKNFVWVSKDQQHVRVHVPTDVVDSTVAEHPEAEPFVRMDTTIGVSLPLAGLDVRLLDRLLRDGWEAAAPKRLVAQHSQVSAAARTIGLPAIGRPAASALGLAGITTLEKVAEHTEKELLALHGMGPTAVRILREALAASGLGFRAR